MHGVVLLKRCAIQARASPIQRVGSREESSKVIRGGIEGDYWQSTEPLASNEHELGHVAETNQAVSLVDT